MTHLLSTDLSRGSNLLRSITLTYVNIQSITFSCNVIDVSFVLKYVLNPLCKPSFGLILAWVNLLRQQEYVLNADCQSRLIVLYSANAKSSYYRIFDIKKQPNIAR